jgi:hypothetical protein
MRAHRATLLTIIAVGVAACAGETPVETPDLPAVTTTGAAGAADTATRRDTTTRRDTATTGPTRTDSARTNPPRTDSTVTPPRPVTPPDTARPAVPAIVSGRVLGQIFNRAGTGSDTLQIVPLAGVTVQLYHQQPVLGAGTPSIPTSLPIAQVVTGADGSYRVGPIPGGRYYLRALPSAGSGFGEGVSHVSVTQAQVTVNLYVWKRASTPPADSTGR